jgi:O-antigen/teichoic acid export membrane protein
VIRVLARKSLLILMVRLTSQVLSFIALLFITRYLGTDVYGSITFSFAIVATFNCVSDLGFNAANTKRISEGKDVDDCFSTFAVIKVVMTGLMALLTLVIVLIYTTFLGRGLSDTSVQLLLIFIGYYVLYDLAGIAIYTFDARMETAKSQIIQLMDPIIRVPIVLFVALNRMSVYSLAIAFLIGAAAVFVGSVFLLLRSGIKWKRPTLFRQYIIFAAPLAIASILSVVWGNVDKIILGFFGTKVDLALYNSGLSLMTILTSVGAGVGIVTFPLFSKHFSEGRLDLIREKTAEAERYISMIVMPLATVVIVFPFAVASILLGSNFTLAGGPLQIVVISTTLGLMTQAYTSQLSAINRNDMYLRITIISLVLNSVLLAILVPSSILGVGLFGLSYMGAAYAGLVTTITVVAFTRATVRRLTHTRSNPRILIHISAAILSGLLLWSLSYAVLPVNHILELIVYSLLSFGFFFGFLAIFKEFSKKDLDYILEVINLKKMWRYIITELRGN